MIFECVKDFQDECEEFVKKETKRSARGIEKIKAITKYYMKYFIQYTGIFDLFFLEKISDISSRQPTIELIDTFLDRLCSEEWVYCVNNNIVSVEEMNMKKDELKYSSTGLLLFYLNRISPDSYDRFLDITNRQLDTILD